MAACKENSKENSLKKQVSCETPGYLHYSKTCREIWGAFVVVCKVKPGPFIGFKPASAKRMTANALRLTDCWNGCLGLNPAGFKDCVHALEMLLEA